MGDIFKTRTSGATTEMDIRGWEKEGEQMVDRDGEGSLQSDHALKIDADCSDFHVGARVARWCGRG